MVTQAFGCEENNAADRPSIRLIAMAVVCWVLAAAQGAVPQLACGVALAADPPEAKHADEEQPKRIEHVDLVHFTHTDFGYTDHAYVCREFQTRYLDIAIDTVLATRAGPAETRFCWTAEGTVAVRDWWEWASSECRRAFLEAVESGQLEVSALPFNQTPTLNERQWQHMLQWLPEQLWRKVRPRAALQNDVNGVPRAGAVALLDRGVRYLLTSINATLGGPPSSGLRPSGGRCRTVGGCWCG